MATADRKRVLDKHALALSRMRKQQEKIRVAQSQFGPELLGKIPRKTLVQRLFPAQMIALLGASQNTGFVPNAKSLRARGERLSQGQPIRK